MKIISIGIQLCFVLLLAYLWIVARILVGTQEVEFAIWKSPYLKELFLWLAIGIPLVLFFQSGSTDEEVDEEKEESVEPSDKPNP